MNVRLASQSWRQDRPALEVNNINEMGVSFSVTGIDVGFCLGVVSVELTHDEWSDFVSRVNSVAERWNAAELEGIDGQS